MNRESFLARESFIEKNARERVRALLDENTFRELLGPFDRLESPWLPKQQIVPQSDDGVVIARGSLGGTPVMIAAVESAFQGGSIGEVSGSKLACALELTLGECEKGNLVHPVLLLETGGVRLQEANLGLAVIAEIHAAIAALTRHVPVVGVVAGMVGCFGGMSLAAGLCSHLIMTRQGRLGMNGPEVIEQESGIEELDAKDHRLVWGVFGGEQRHRTNLADTLVDDDAGAFREVIRAAFQRGVPERPRSAQVERSLLLRQHSSPPPPLSPRPPSSEPARRPSRGQIWFTALTGVDGAQLRPGPGGSKSVWSTDAPLAGETARFIAVVPDRENRFPRAREGEVGLEQGWALAREVRDVLEADANGARRPIVAIVDVKSQAYGRTEELLGIHLACAAAVDAYARARMAGHPVMALIVGSAMSGAFLAHGYQANRILALDAAGVSVHAMSKAAAARVTRRTVEEVEALGDAIVPMSYSVNAYAQLGTLHRLIAGVNADAPSGEDVRRVSAELAGAVRDARGGARDLGNRLLSPEARTTRAASLEVRRRLGAQWTEG
ncbi:MAG TPA: biotin-independent malonate decarboxylase subunit beta [Polyangiaceae bacterium]|nr:biotin-independent malonate decarboxylase subunit beta [Polyangiaceae bacterium]